MADSLKRISAEKFTSWLDRLSERREVFFPRPGEPDWVFERWEAGGCFEVSPYRALESVKSFLFPSRSRVADFPADQTGLPPLRETVVAGLKACDLRCLPVLDYIFLQGDHREPFYARRRESLTLISFDCTGFKETCFCPIVGGAPHPDTGFDLNFSPWGDDFLVEIGSEKGRALMEEAGDLFTAAPLSAAAARRDARQGVESALRAQLSAQGQIEKAPSAAVVRSRSEDGFWKKEAVPCVECGACNLVCPTCHCFILEEAGTAESAARWRNWDSCQYPGFARVAGGANPRSRRGQRLSNRFSKKFEFFPEKAGVIACTGCGRCYEGCLGKIDIREILKIIATEEKQTD